MNLESLGQPIPITLWSILAVFFLVVAVPVLVAFVVTLRTPPPRPPKKRRRFIDRDGRVVN